MALDLASTSVRTLHELHPTLLIGRESQSDKKNSAATLMVSWTRVLIPNENVVTLRYVGNDPLKSTDELPMRPFKFGFSLIVRIWIFAMRLR